MKICNSELNAMIDSIIDGFVKPFETIYTGFTRLIDNTRVELENLKIR